MDAKLIEKVKKANHLEVRINKMEANLARSMRVLSFLQNAKENCVYLDSGYELRSNFRIDSLGSGSVETLEADEDLMIDLIEAYIKQVERQEKYVQLLEEELREL
jgi:hypothetical protein